MLERILVATNFRPSAEDAMKTAQTFNSEVTLIHVIPEIPGSPIDLHTLKAESRAGLGKLNTQLNEAGIRTGNPVVAVGSPFDQITQASELLDVNLIVTGSGGSVDSGARRPGYINERLIRKSSKPVCVVKSGAPPAFQRILCAVDYSDSSARALTNAIHLARAYQAELTVLTVIQTLAGLYQINANLARDAQSGFDQKEEKRLETFLKQFDFTDVRWSSQKKKGVPEWEILRFSQEWQADLLVMGSVGRTGHARIVLGTVTARVLHEMPCSVITLKAEHAILLELEAEIENIRKQWERGQELLKTGFPEEAIRQFQNCLIKDKFHVPALQGLADAHTRMGHREQAERYGHTAKILRAKMKQDSVEAAIRGEYSIWRKPEQAG